MMRFTFFTLLAVSLFGRHVFAADILWLKVAASFTYKDISTICSTTHFPKTLYFGAEVDGTQINLAVLKDSTFEFASKIGFLKEELSGIELHQDKFGRLWMKNLTLSARLLGWVFTNAGDSFGGCKPPQPLKTVSPAPFAFAFNVDGLGESVIYSESQLGTFKGQRKDGSAYVATVQWRQRQFDPNPDWNRFDSELGNSDDQEAVSTNARGSSVFADRQDCRAIAMNNPGLCRGQDCRGVLYNILSYCRSNDCKAMVRGLAGLCQTRDCRAVVYNNVGFCESFNCRAVLYGNAGLCR